MKKMVIYGSLIGLLSIGILAGTADATPKVGSSEILEEVTGKRAAELGVTTEKRLGEMANKTGQSQEFQEKIRDSREERLKEAVEQGRITQEQADQRMEQIIQNQENCDGSGAGSGLVRDNGMGMGRGRNGNGTGRGSCFNQ